jgi:hypothetical protein
LQTFGEKQEMKTIKSIYPDENWNLLIEFEGEEYRLLNLSIPRTEFDWTALAYPQHMKRFTLTASEILWDFGGKLDSNYLYLHSSFASRSDLERHSIRIGYKNQAPTDEDKNHHVYGVYLYPFKQRLFSVGESIGGGHADRGGSRSFSLSELLGWVNWKNQFELSGCDWAIDIIEQKLALKVMIAALVSEACKRNGV